MAPKSGPQACAKGAVPAKKNTKFWAPFLGSQGGPIFGTHGMKYDSGPKTGVALWPHFWDQKFSQNVPENRAGSWKIRCHRLRKPADRAAEEGSRDGGGGRVEEVVGARCAWGRRERKNEREGLHLLSTFALSRQGRAEETRDRGCRWPVVKRGADTNAHLG